LLVAGVENEHVWSVASDIVYQNGFVTAFIGAHQWPRNHGHVLIIPNQHFENLYELPLELGTQIHRAARLTALAMKSVYGCDGVSTRQHNEPAGNQDVWHYHLHLFPRYRDDLLYASKPQPMEAAERATYASRLRDWFQDQESPDHQE
jgi:histidine triad (HIT) family protein